MLQECSLVMAYYDNADMLLRHFEAWEKYPRELKARMRFIVVDDGSPKRPAWGAYKDFGGLPHTLKFALFRVVPNIPWNQDGARNLALKHSETEWTFMTDMDHLLSAEQAARMLTIDAQPKTYYMPDQLLTNGDSLGRPHPNTYLMRTADFWGMGGYDEDFAGYYGSDGNFRRCAQGAGLTEQHTQHFSTTVYRTEDCFDANTKDWGRKGSSLHVAFNQRLMRKKALPPYKAINPIRFAWERVL